MGQDELTTNSRKARQHYLKAEQSLLLQDFDQASASLKNALEIDSRFIEAYLLQAELFTQTKHYPEAIQSYLDAIKIDSAFFLPAYGLLGELYMKTGQYHNAYLFFSKAKSKLDSESAAAKRLSNMIKQAHFADSIVNQPVATVAKLGLEKLNSPDNEYINGLRIDNQMLLFTRRAAKLTEETGNDAEQIYFAAVSNGMVQSISLFDRLVAFGNHGAASLSADGKTIYFSACGWATGQGSCDLYVLESAMGQWREPHSLGGMVNSASWESQPSLTPDSRELYFSSNREGGFGGSDIYKSVRLQDGSWSRPINLGNEINTPANEMAPFIHPDGKTLYFSSDGHRPSLGQRDIFVCKADATGRWQRPLNAGFPINSQGNDMSMIVGADAITAFVSSDRRGEQSDYDVYAFLLDDPRIAPQRVQYMRVRVVDAQTGLPLRASYKVTDLSDGLLVFDDQTDDQGEMLLPVMPGKDYGLQLVHPGYLFYSSHLSHTTAQDSTEMHMVAKLQPLKKGSKIILNNVFFQTSSAQLDPASFAELKVMSKLLNENSSLNILLSGHTDNTGDSAFNQRLSVERAEAVKAFFVKEGIPAQRIRVEGWGAARPLSDNESEIGRSRNRRTELEIVSD